MENYLHRIVGIYGTKAAADAARERLIDGGIPTEQIKLLEPGHTTPVAESTADSDDVLKEVLRDGAIGTAVGTLAGTAGTIALVLANVSLFIASPVVGALSMLGWGASLGGIIGAAAGARGTKGNASDLIQDALGGGYVVLVAFANTEEQTTHAKQVIADSMDVATTPARSELGVAATSVD